MDEDGSDIFESDDENAGDINSDIEVSDPEDEPSAKRTKTVSNKEFQKKLKNTNSKFAVHDYN